MHIPAPPLRRRRRSRVSGEEGKAEQHEGPLQASAGQWGDEVSSATQAVPQSRAAGAPVLHQGHPEQYLQDAGSLLGCMGPRPPRGRQSPQCFRLDSLRH